MRRVGFQVVVDEDDKIIHGGDESWDFGSKDEEQKQESQKYSQQSARCRLGPSLMKQGQLDAA
jgi:hypothetical protein